MKKLFVLFALAISTSTGAFNDALNSVIEERSGKSSSQPEKEVQMNILAMANDAIRDTDRLLSQPQKEVQMNTIAMANDAIRDTDRIIAQPKKEVQMNILA